jgi:uncharacterized protein
MKYLVLAKPNAKKELVEKVGETTLRVSVKAHPQKGKANDAILKVLMKYFNVSRSEILFLSGKSSKYKYFVLLND